MIEIKKNNKQIFHCLNMVYINYLPSTETTEAVANKLQTGPVETFQKTQISESELISKGQPNTSG